MNVPIARSEFYRWNGRPRAVHAYGRVLFLSPAEYAAIKPHMVVMGIRDATEEEIASQDVQYDRAMEVERREMNWLRRLFGGDRKPGL